MLSDYVATLEQLFHRTGAGVKLGLETIADLLKHLGSPEDGIRFVVVAGTNGKGSTSALLAAVLQQAGFRTGLFTSPHLMRFTERIRIDGDEISQDQVKRFFARICSVEHLCPRPPTFFECTTAMALLAFAEANVDIAVLEVGLGGRLDATNVVPKTLAVITPVSLDHQKFLGSTLTEIAGEKAAIIPRQGTVVVAPQADEANAVVDAVIGARGAERIDVEQPVQNADGTWQLNGFAPLSATSPWTIVPFLRQNMAVAATAVQALRRLAIRCSAQHFELAVSQYRWRGRYHWAAEDILLDAAHNAAGMEALVEALQQDPATRHPGSDALRPIHCVFSSLRDKPGEALMARLRPWVRQFYLCPVHLRRSRNEEELRTLDPTALVLANATEALDRARQAAAGDGGFVLVAGSIFLLAEALGLVTGEPFDPPVSL